jgi:hypothetical protein
MPIGVLEATLFLMTQDELAEAAISVAKEGMGVGRLFPVRAGVLSRGRCVAG